jgi:ABC-type amino acid transport substrate-binding protein
MMACLVMIIGIGVFGWTIAQLSSAITLQTLHSDITDHWDLRDRLVATVEGTTSVTALEKLGAVVIPAKSIDQAYDKLLKEEVNAVFLTRQQSSTMPGTKGLGKFRLSARSLTFNITASCSRKEVNYANRLIEPF